ncbi:MAG: ATP-dependent helicase, RecQ family, partial [Thermomicrobiales bacterium]|nr:ATP-dependent helicase, RecQ family [Thermomicrobiales bacterium]
FNTVAEKREALVHRVIWADKPGIVYTGTRKGAEEVMRALEDEGVSSVYYHAGLAAKEREAIHEAFMAEQADVIVATNAFGMGVDKANVRFVYHLDAPDSLDSYYQEIGRAGRDGEKAEAILFYRKADIGAQSFKTGEGRIDLDVLERLAETGDPEAVAQEAGLSTRKLMSALQRLEDAGTPEAAVALQEQRREMKKERLEAMRAYADLAACRREHLLRYLGDDFTGPCAGCDNCDAAGGHTVAAAGGTRREVL